MKKYILILCLFTICISANAENVFPYQNNSPLNCPNNIIKTRGNSEYVTIPPREIFNPLHRASGAGIVTAAALPALLLDPYVITIDGNTYVMIKDNGDKNWSKDNLIGINDPKGNRFESLIKLNSDKDYSKITPQELKNANIRFVRKDSKGRLLVNDKTKDFDLNKIDYIDIINLKRTANSDVTGIFGHFTVYIKSKNSKSKAIVGYVTYETNNEIEILFK